MRYEVVVSEGDVVTHLHLVEQPIRVALQDFREVDANVAGRLAKAVHDSAQRGFMDPQHSCQAILPDAGGVHPQLEVRINVSIQGHSSALFSMELQHPVGAEEAVTTKVLCNIRAKL